MSTETPLVITISRLFGSGGGLIGQRIAKRLNLQFLDKEIVNRAAEKLEISVKDLEMYDEQVTPLWQSALVASSFTSPTPFTAPPILTPNDKVIFAAQAEIIKKSIEHEGAVIVGRGANFLLHNHPKHIGIFVHSEIDIRVERVMKRENISQEEARKLVETTDKTRAKFMKTLTGQDWMQVWMYHLSIDTGVIDIKAAEEVILYYVKTRFPDIKIS